MSTGDELKPCGTRYPRWIDRAFAKGLAPRRRRALRRHVEGCAFCRERYDRLGYASAALADAPLGWDAMSYIEGEVLRGARGARDAKRVWLAGGAVAAAAAAAVLLLLFLPRGPAEVRFAERGAETIWKGMRPPGVRLFCLSIGGASARVAGEARFVESGIPEAALRCRIDGELQLAYSTPSLNGLTMVAFGRSEEGRTLYYAPRSADADSLSLAPDRIDEPLGWSTRLGVNHAPGPYRLFVRFYDRPVTAAAAASGEAEPLWELRARLEVTGVRGETP